MRRFDVDGRSYIRINGKTFYLLRGYCIRYDKWILVQVFGTTALTKDDLPEKNWEVVATKGSEGKVYTAWKPSYFDGSNETRVFVGASYVASVRLLIAARLADPLLSRAVAAATAENRPPYDSGISTLDDKGSSGVPAVMLDRDYQFNEWIRQVKEKPCQ